jgi:hypothetical protein
MAPAHRTPKQLQLDGLPTIHPNAAGMDIGAELIVVAVPPDRDPEPVRAYRTFTPDLLELLTWLVACGIDTVAMESTGVYWVAIYELLEAHGLVPYLVNARHVRMVPDARPTGTTPNGSRSSTRSGFSKLPFAQMPKLSHSARSCAIAPRSFSIARPTSTRCSRRSK